jgi:hypothetical protein
MAGLQPRPLYLDGHSGRRLIRLARTCQRIQNGSEFPETHTMFRRSEIIWLFGELGTKFAAVLDLVAMLEKSP